MAAVTFGGVGSGIDTEAIITGLLSASRGPISRIQTQQTQTNSAVSSVSDVGNLLGKLKDALVALDTSQEVGSFKAGSDNKAIAVSANGSARAGSFEVNVTKLASAYKAYSDPLGVTASNQQLNKSGTLELKVGNGESKLIQIEDTDTLDMVISKINSSGLRVAATSFFDGSEFRMQLRGLDTGTENDVTVSGDQTFNFNGQFNGIDNTKSRGESAEVEIDGFKVTSKTNQIQGAIAGVTLALTAKTPEGAATVTVESDAQGFKDKLTNLVNAYNAVVNKVHTEAGFGSIKASNPVLAGDSSLRAVGSRLNDILTKTVGNGKFQTLRSIGIELNNNGTLKLNSTALDAALAEDPDSVSKVLAGDDSSVKGVADMMVAATTDLLSSKGAIQARKDGLAARQKLLSDRVDLEEARLDRLEAQLRKQFTQMDGAVAANNAQLNFLQR